MRVLTRQGLRLFIGFLSPAVSEPLVDLEQLGRGSLVSLQLAGRFTVNHGISDPYWIEHGGVPTRCQVLYQVKVLPYVAVRWGLPARVGLTGGNW
jgi:hypothetical protein